MREQPGVYIPSFPQGGHRRVDETGLGIGFALSPVPKPRGTSSSCGGGQEGRRLWNNEGHAFTVGAGNITARSPLIERRVLDLTGPLDNLTGTARSPLIERRLNELAGCFSAEKRVPKNPKAVASMGVYPNKSNKRCAHNENWHPNQREGEEMENSQLSVLFSKKQQHQQEQEQQQQQQQQQQQEEEEGEQQEQESHIDIGDLMPLRSLDHKGVSVADHQEALSDYSPLSLRPYLHINNSLHHTPTEMKSTQSIQTIHTPSPGGTSPCLFHAGLSPSPCLFHAGLSPCPCSPSPCPGTTSPCPCPCGPSPGPSPSPSPSPCPDTTSPSPHATVRTSPGSCPDSPVIMSFSDCVDVEEEGGGEEQGSGEGGRYLNAR